MNLSPEQEKSASRAYQLGFVSQTLATKVATDPARAGQLFKRASAIQDRYATKRAAILAKLQPHLTAA